MMTGRPSLTGKNVKSLSPAAQRFLDTKGDSTGTAYRSCLKRFKAFYPGGLDGFIGEIEAEMQGNQGKPLAERVRPGEATIRGFVRWMEEQGYANKSVRQAVAALQNALKYYGVTVSTSFIELPPDRPMKENEKHQWTLDQVRQFVEAAEYLRDKCYILFQFQSGLSIGDITDLNYGDIRREYENGTVPLAIEGYRRKTNAPIRTFVGHDTVQLLRLYLQSRKNLTNDSPLFTMLGSEERATPGALNKKLREYADKLDFIYEEDLENGYSPARSHSLRAAFRSRLTGKMDGDLIELFMAHDIGQQRSTYINMPLDELREIYANYEHLLSIGKTSLDVKTEGPPGVNEQAFSKLADQVGALTRKNAEVEARLENVVEELETQRELMRRLSNLLDTADRLRADIEEPK